MQPPIFTEALGIAPRTPLLPPPLELTSGETNRNSTAKTAIAARDATLTFFHFFLVSIFQVSSLLNGSHTHLDSHWLGFGVVYGPAARNLTLKSILLFRALGCDKIYEPVEL